MSVKRTDAVELIEERDGLIPQHLDEPDPPVREGKKGEKRRGGGKRRKMPLFLFKNGHPPTYVSLVALLRRAPPFLM
jgi:hypothetical protein